MLNAGATLIPLIVAFVLFTVTKPIAVGDNTAPKSMSVSLDTTLKLFVSFSPAEPVSATPTGASLLATSTNWRMFKVELE